MRSMWKTLRKRRQTLIFSLKKAFKDEVQISGSTSGMHVVLQFKNDFSESAILKSAQQAGLSCASTAQFYAHSPKANEFMLRFSGHSDEEIEARVNEFAIVLNTNHRA